MSDGITESRRGTYFSDRSKKISKKELIERRIERIKMEIDDLRWELQDLEDQLKKQDNGK